MLFWNGILITLLAAYLVFRLVVRRDYLERGKLGPLAVSLEFVIFALHANLIYFHLSVPWPQLPPLPENPLLLYLGAGISIMGLLATLAIMAHLGFSTTVGQQPGDVRHSGPYRWTRNPQLITYGLMILGLVGLYPSVESVAWFLLYGVIGYLMVLTEEEHLRNLFGVKYEEYCERVPRFLFRMPGMLQEKSKE